MTRKSLIEYLAEDRGVIASECEGFELDDTSDTFHHISETFTATKSLLRRTIDARRNDVEPMEHLQKKVKARSTARH